MNIETVPWLKCNARKKRLSGIILHHTAGGSAASTIGWLRKKWVRASYHYIIDRDGTIFKCVPVSKRAWHAGRSRGKFGRDVNSQTIGIAFANRGNGEEYPEAQVKACHDLVVELCRVLPGLDWISTHRLITRRKIDPAHFGFEDFMVSVRKTLNEEQNGRWLKMWLDDKLGRDWDG